MTNHPPDVESLLRRTTELALAYIESLPERHVGAREDAAEIAERLRVSLPDEAEDPMAVIERLASDVDPGLVASAGPRRSDPKAPAPAPS